LSASRGILRFSLEGKAAKGGGGVMPEAQVMDEIEGLLSKEEMTREDVRRLRALALSGRSYRESVEGQVEELRAGDDKVKLAAALLALGRFEEAKDVAGSVKDVAEVRFISGLCLKAMGDKEGALAAFEEILEKDSKALDVMLEIGDLKRESGDVAEALKIADKVLKKDEKNADAHVLKGYCHETEDELEEAAEEYERALKLDQCNAAAAFRAGYLMSLRGEDDEAIEYYEKCISCGPSFLNAHLNLGVLYEDAEEYDKAIGRYERALELDPGNPRALLFLKDAVASLDMYYDEEREKRADRRNKIMQTPLSEFELSIRSRNCLEKMNLRTLGDLMRTTEQDLLNYKNFGETSLKEIKDLLGRKGLRLGQEVEESEVERVRQALTGERESDERLSRPVSSLDLSVRSRRCMDTLGVSTVGELIQKTPQELMSCKNFGQTSLDEVKRKLGEVGLALRDVAS